MDKTLCPNCGKTKKPWFALCLDCNAKEKPRCEVCNIEVPEGHNLCKPHWKEKFEDKKKLQSIEFVKNKKETEFKEKFEGKYYFNSQKVKSKSELLICYFLSANNINFEYEPLMTLDQEFRPDFVMYDKLNNVIILEHFGLDSEGYKLKQANKESQYEKYCKANPNFHFINTTEEDICNLKDRLGKKLNGTPLKQGTLEIVLNIFTPNMLVN
jgi:hypothetical protein